MVGNHIVNKKFTQNILTNHSFCSGKRHWKYAMAKLWIRHGQWFVTNNGPFDQWLASIENHRHSIEPNACLFKNHNITTSLAPTVAFQPLMPSDTMDCLANGGLRLPLKTIAIPSSPMDDSPKPLTVPSPQIVFHWSGQLWIKGKST